MPGKHVHFVDVPSPSTTNSTLSNSPGPMTPPQLYYSPLHGTKVMYAPSSSPRPATHSVALHPLLARAPSGTPLNWDLALPAESARPNVPGLPSRITDKVVCEPATHPALPTLAVVCDFLPWTLTITPTPHALWAAPYVTVGDVLHALYRALRLGVSDPELAVLEPGQQDRVRDAYVRRYRRAPAGEREQEKAKSIKRVDFLRDHRAFLGLAPVPGGLPAKGLVPGAVWALHVARSP
ncbi:uncharacterized protein BXZ73DRAFT_50961 [Epithele typhae]|uniref:uncharacterized protein n=1 Tax=Epithele typhae TaxID=378194 RepID=UPI002007C275|nr:uncharacterized protein BXZ73DRAFT_50961 [Epithele typhae]KAH9923401.1 hypothetical protein BXZ73DRAFT_50961 [Epithele typhae]